MLTCATLILNHNGCNLLPPLFDSLLEQEGLTAICLIDNASTDDSVELTQTRYPRIEIIQNRQNLNFGTAYNRAIATRSEEVIFIVNNDVIVHAGAVQNALIFLENNPDVASVSFVRLDPNLKKPFSSPTPCPPLVRFGKEFSPAHHFLGPDGPPRESPCYLWGAAACIRREIFDLVRFDEAMDWGFEDIDLGWSIARKTRMRHVFLPRSTFFHLESHSSRKRFRQREIKRMITRNAILSFAKNATPLELLRAAPHIAFQFFRCNRRGELARLVAQRLMARCAHKECEPKPVMELT